MDYGSRLRAWETKDRLKGCPRPRQRLLPNAVALRTISWWAVIIQLTGMLVREHRTHGWSPLCCCMLLCDALLTG